MEEICWVMVEFRFLGNGAEEKTMVKIRRHRGLLNKNGVTNVFIFVWVKPAMEQSIFGRFRASRRKTVPPFLSTAPVRGRGADGEGVRRATANKREATQRGYGFMRLIFEKVGLDQTSLKCLKKEERNPYLLGNLA